MIAAIEIVMFLVGIAVLVTGRLPLAPYRVVRGAQARMLGILAMAPVPLATCVGAVTVVLMSPQPQQYGKDPSIRGTLIALETGIVVGCAALVYGIGWMVSGTRAASRRDPQADLIRSCVPVPGEGNELSRGRPADWQW